jgi:iron complex outermembrane receptor protein
MDQGSAGFGHYSERTSVTFNYDFESGRYGVPFSSIAGGGTTNDPVDLDWKRQHTRFQFTRRDLGVLDRFTALVNYTDWNHKELEGEEVGTEFFNKQFTYQGTAVQKTAGTFSSSFGFWGLYRDYKSVGLESLSPPVTQNAIAGYLLEQVNFERFRLQFGGRVENNRYHPQGLESRSFTGFSGAAGINVNLWRHGVFVANYTHSYRAPAIEELYNNGPHVGNLAFEIGNPELLRERGNGIELSLRQQNQKIKAEANAYYYRFSDYIFLAATNQFEEGLRVARYLQAATRYMGAEGKVDAVLSSHLTLNLGVDAVDAKLTGSGVYLPRIPPVRGRIGVDTHWGGLSVRPEVIIANAQWKLYPTETRTAGYAVFNLTGSYTITRQHVMHVFNVNFFNAGDRLYYNHLSFIKDLAPEIGRGVRVSYTLNFY